MARILVIDDEASVRTMFANMFSDFNHEVIEAATGREGLVLFHQDPADLAIVDIALPGMDGIEVIQRLKADFPDARIIAITGYRPALLADAVNLGVQATFVKPFKYDEMTETVENLVGGESPEVDVCAG